MYTEESMSTLGIGILGTGWVAGEHIKSYRNNPHCHIVALCSLTRGGAGAEVKAGETGATDAKIYDTYAQMLADPEVNIISICTPPNQHSEQTIQAAEAGKHLLIEKAAANDPKSLGAMLRAVEKAGVRT